MINFFRKIRQKLLSENRLRKYLLYAIGEIVLVMIGILLALQVNNWNENRKYKNAQEVILRSIKQDLKADVTYLRNFLARVDSSYQLLKKQSEKVNRISYSKDSLINFLKNDINVFVPTFDGYNNNTYESMKASGKLDLLDNQIKAQLYDLSILQNTNQEEYQTLRDGYFDEIETLVASYPISVPFSFVKNTAQNDFVWQDVEKKDMMLKLNSWGTVKANFFRNIIRNFKPTQEKTEVILNSMKN